MIGHHVARAKALQAKQLGQTTDRHPVETPGFCLGSGLPDGSFRPAVPSDTCGICHRKCVAEYKGQRITIRIFNLLDICRSCSELVYKLRIMWEHMHEAKAEPQVIIDLAIGYRKKNPVTSKHLEQQKKIK